MNKNKQRGSVTAAVAGLIATIGLFVGMMVMITKCERIDPGAVGVSVKKCDQGGVAKAPIPTGYYWRELFCEDVVEYPTNLQTLILTNQDGEGDDDHDEAITVTSSEGLPISVDTALSFTLNPAKVPALYERFRQDIDHLKTVFVRQTIREALQATYSKYTAEELYSTKREIARAETQKFLETKLVDYGFTVAQFTVNETRVPQQVVTAINNKVSMIQEAQRSEQEVRKKTAEAQQQIAAAKGVSESNRVTAEGEAASITLRAEAQAKANRLIGESLTPQVIDYERARRWDGKLPQVSGTASPFVTLK